MIHVTAIADGSSPDLLVVRQLDIDPQEFKLRLNEFLNTLVDDRVTSSKKVIVLDVDDATLELFLEAPGRPAPRNGRFAALVEPGHTFPSALAASAWLGFNNNEVALYLGKARREHPDDKDAGLRTAKVRGVTLIYDLDHALAYKD